MMWSCTATIFEEPISINHAYSVFRGRLHLKSAGKAFKSRLTAAVAACTPDWKTLHSLVADGHDLELWISLGFPDLQNKTYGSARGAEHRYKKKDASNYIKLIEDAVSRGSGIDDRYHVRVAVDKEHTTNPYVSITLKVRDGKT